MSKAPVLRELLERAESQDNVVISEATMVQAVSARITEEHGTAYVIFKQADWNDAGDAWRRIIRQVDHGRLIRHETLR